MDWRQFQRQHPDAIRNNPGVERCKGCLVRTINEKTKRFFCQLRYDHTGDCINFSGHKKWMKGFKEVTWTQLRLNENESTPMSIEQAVSEAVSNHLSQPD